MFGWNLDHSFECFLVVNMMELHGCYQCYEGTHITVLNLMISITSIKDLDFKSISKTLKMPYEPYPTTHLESRTSFKLELFSWGF